MLILTAQYYGLTMQEILLLNTSLESSRIVAGAEIQLVQAAPPRLRSVHGLVADSSKSIGCSPRVSLSQNAVTLLYSGYTALRHQSGQSPNECFDSQVRLFCLNGSCGVFFDSGKYGYHPLRCSAVRISQRIWRWCGNQPDAVGLEMWPHLKDGVEVATRLSQWPEGVTNSREYPVQINRAKILTYNASLGSAPTP